ncbi:hypothetical protein A2U01_0057271 [Trifolium medium]|uniref:Uncharacterized protein n=1 Tax=Trifolium medium TaxID=97028 RepID=A0A392RII3_9FABA|nr:hypothetical protein [Trifolium medium]
MDKSVTVVTKDHIDESHNRVFTTEVSKKDNLVTNNRPMVDTIDTSSQTILAQTGDVNTNVFDVRGAPL